MRTGSAHPVLVAFLKDMVADYHRLPGYPIPDHLNEETVRVRDMQPSTVASVDGRCAPSS